MMRANSHRSAVGLLERLHEWIDDGMDAMRALRSISTYGEDRAPGMWLARRALDYESRDIPNEIELQHAAVGRAIHAIEAGDWE